MVDVLGVRSPVEEQNVGPEGEGPVLDAVVQATSDLVVVVDVGGTVVWAGPQAYALFGYPPGSRLGSSVAELLHPDDILEARKALTSVVEEGDQELAEPFRARVRHYGGWWVWVDITARNLVDEPSVGGVVMCIRDATGQVEAERALEREREFVEAVLETAGALVVVLTPDGDFVRFNRAAEQLTGYSAEEVLGQYFGMFLVPEEARDVSEVLDDLRNGHYPNVYENDWVTRSGERRTIRWTNTALPGPDGKPEHIIGTGIDVTVERAAQRELARRATHDSLTGLPNRDLFLDRLERAVERLDGGSRAVGLLFVDLDDFKGVNDQYGHSTGDRTLTAVAGRLQRAVRPDDLVARLGGDEFVVLCGHLVDTDAIGAVAQRILDAFADPVRVGSYVFPVRASVGSAVTRGPMQRPEALVDQADRQMYHSKRSVRRSAEDLLARPAASPVVPPVPVDEVERLAELDALGLASLQDDPVLDDLIRLATYVCESPIGAITFVTADQQLFSSIIGAEAVTAPREHAFCAFTIAGTKPLVVPDLVADERFRSNPFVTSDPNIRFYAGAPLRTAAGHALGSLCVLDQVPRRLRSDQLAALQTLAHQAVVHLENRAVPA